MAGHDRVGVKVSQSELIHGDSVSSPRGKALPGLSDFKEAAAAQGPRADSWYGSNGTTISRVLSTLGAATATAKSAQGSGAKSDVAKTEERGLKSKPSKSAEVASKGDDQSHAIATSALTNMIQEIVLGSDDRQMIADTSASPFAWICGLSMTDSTGTQWLGTGWLAAPGLVITAGHCVYLTNQGGWAH